MPGRELRHQLKMRALGDGPSDTATVVIGIDSSGNSWGAFRWGCEETRRLGGRAIAVCIRPMRSLATGICGTASLAALGYSATDWGVHERSAHMVEAMRHEAAGLNLAFAEAFGDPVAELLWIAGKVHADLIVIGSVGRTWHGRPGLVGQRLAARRRQAVIVVVPLPGRPIMRARRWQRFPDRLRYTSSLDRSGLGGASSHAAMWPGCGIRWPRRDVPARCPNRAR